MKRNIPIKIIIVLPVLVVGLFGIKTGITNAYFSDTDKTINTVEIGKNNIKLNNDGSVPASLNVGENIYQKEISVTNNGSVPCFVRVFMDLSDSKVKETTKFSSDGSQYWQVNEYNNHLPENWTYEETGDLAGFYYYNQILEPGESTSDLIKSVNTVFNTKDDIIDYEIITYAESVQSIDKDGNPLENTDYLVAFKELVS